VISRGTPFTYSCVVSTPRSKAVICSVTFARSTARLMMVTLHVLSRIAHSAASRASPSFLEAQISENYPLRSPSSLRITIAELYACVATTANRHTFPLRVIRDRVRSLLLAQVTRQMRGACGMCLLVFPLGKFGRAFDGFQVHKRFEKDKTACYEKGETICLSERV
jgi:hypothetical protein